MVNVYSTSQTMTERPISFHSSQFFFFNDTATTEIYTLSLHDALPISVRSAGPSPVAATRWMTPTRSGGDRKSTRLNSSHVAISYAVFGLKKKKIVSVGAYFAIDTDPKFFGCFVCFDY